MESSSGQYSPMSKLVLLVDDEPMIREILVELLQPLDIELVEAANGKEAMQKLRENPNILSVVSDIQMPHMNGVQFIRTARSEGFNQPFIFFTAFTSRETILEITRHRVHGFIEKGGMDGVEEAVLSSLQSNTAAGFDVDAWLKKYLCWPN